MEETLEFVDAQERARKHPKTFEAPDADELKEITVGSFVKVCTHDERFWVEVTLVEGDTITGTVGNDLVLQGHGLSYDDTITFDETNVYDILSE